MISIDSWSVPDGMPIVRIDDVREFYKLALMAYRNTKQVVLNEHGLLILFYNNVCYVYYSNGADARRELRHFIRSLNSEEFKQKDDKLFKLALKLNDLAHELYGKLGFRYCEANNIAELWFNELMQLPIDIIITMP